jgi:hypothetical protein
MVTRFLALLVLLLASCGGLRPVTVTASRSTAGPCPSLASGRYVESRDADGTCGEGVIDAADMVVQEGMPDGCNGHRDWDEGTCSFSIDMVCPTLGRPVRVEGRAQLVADGELRFVGRISTDQCSSAVVLDFVAT